jgi:hypothetical protein
MVVNGSLAAASGLTVSPAATLGGSGLVNGSVTVNGTLAPGNGVGTLNTGAETWNSGSHYVCELNATNANGCDLLNITGALNIQATSGNPFIVKVVSLTSSNTSGRLANFNKFISYTWTIATASGSISSFASNKFSLDTSAFANDFTGGSFAVGVSGNSLVLNYFAAPLVYPRFTAVSSLGAGGMQLSSTGGAGQAYVLFASTNLALPTWIPIATGIAGANGLFQFTDPQATNWPQRFYRVTSP